MPFFFFKVTLTFQHSAHVDTGTGAALWISLCCWHCNHGLNASSFCTQRSCSSNVLWTSLWTKQHPPAACWGAKSRSHRRSRFKRKIKMGGKWMCLDTREREGEGIASVQGKLSLLLVPSRLERTQAVAGKVHAVLSDVVGLSMMLGTCPPLLFLYSLNHIRTSSIRHCCERAAVTCYGLYFLIQSACIIALALGTSLKLWSC